MRAKELVPILAEIYGVPFETAFMIDRSLAECGLREKGRGKSLPEMTRKEALTFLIACMTVQKATKAGNDIQPWLNVRDAIFGPTPASDLAEGEVDREFPKRKYIFDNFEPLVTKLKEGRRDVGIVGFLLALCHLIQKDKFHGYRFRLRFELSHGTVEVEVHDEIEGLFETYLFYQSGFHEAPDVIKGIHRSTYVYEEALHEIIFRTADPLEDE